MRVIGGRSRGRRLAARLPRSVRPTSDRVRESIFDILGSQGGVEGLHVVDLFCGSGALGVEALSRGAASATFVDLDPEALAAVRLNLDAVGLADEPVTLVRASLPGWLEGGAAGSFDLALCDPPYDFADWPGAARCAAGRGGRHGIVITDRAPRGLGGHERTTVRRYARHRGSSQQRRLVKVGLFPGSFDPFHNGHLEIVERASRLFDEVVVAALRNPQKSAPSSTSRSARPCSRRWWPTCPRCGSSRCRRCWSTWRATSGASAIVRGLRAVSDFETEMQMAQMNNHLSGVETIFIPTSSKYSFVASKLVREVARFGGDVSAFVPPVVAKHLVAKFEAQEKGAGG